MLFLFKPLPFVLGIVCSSLILGPFQRKDVSACSRKPSSSADTRGAPGVTVQKQLGGHCGLSPLSWPPAPLPPCLASSPEAELILPPHSPGAPKTQQS